MNLIAAILHKCFQLKSRKIIDLTEFISDVEWEVERITEQELIERCLLPRKTPISSMEDEEVNHI